MTVEEIYKQTVELSDVDRDRLIDLLVNDLSMSAPNSIRDEQHLIAELAEGMKSRVHRVTDESWDHILAEIERRHSI